MLGGEVLGGEVLGGEVLGGEVLGGEVLGGEVLGGEVLEGEVLGGEVLGGEVLGGEVLGGEVLGGEVLGGEVLGGEVLEGEVLGGEVDRWRFRCRRISRPASAWRSDRVIPARSSARSTRSTSAIEPASSAPDSVIASSHTRRSSGSGRRSTKPSACKRSTCVPVTARPCSRCSAARV